LKTNPLATLAEERGIPPFQFLSSNGPLAEEEEEKKQF
jgi:hypothetical protein